MSMKEGDRRSLGHHSITVTEEKRDEFHVCDGELKGVQYIPIGKKKY